MKAANIGLCATLALCAGSTSSAMAEDKPALQSAEWNGKVVTPLRVARFNSNTGEIGEWYEYETFAGRSFDCTGGLAQPVSLVYDAFESDWDNSAGTGSWLNPIDGDNLSDCGGSFGAPLPSSRWYFGTGYCNTFTVGDMDLTVNPNGNQAGGGSVNAAAFAINYFGDDGQGPNPGYGAGPGNLENLWIIHETYEDFDATGAGPPADNFLSGWILDYGTQTYTNAGYTIFFAELCDGDIDGDGEQRDERWVQPADGQGGFTILMASDIQDTDGDGTIDVIVASSCAQPMLWGTGTNEAVASGDGQPDNTRPGDQDEFSWDDDGPRDGVHDAGIEIYSYAGFGICPDPLGQMIMHVGNGCQFDLANWNLDDVYNTSDFLAYLNDYNAVLGGGSFVNQDPDIAPPLGALNTADFIAYLNRYSGCQK